MRAARETFLAFLSSNLPDVTIRNIRRDVKNAQLAELAESSINVEFIYDRPGVSQSILQVSIDIIYDDEFQAIDTANALWKLLSASEITPLMSYEDPANPIPLGNMLRWSSRQVKFNKLVSDLFFRYNCHLLLFYADPTMTIPA